MAKVPHGLPFSFVWQSVEKLDPPSFPRSYTVMLPQEYPTWVSLRHFMLNIGLVGSTGFIVFWITGRRKTANVGK